MTFQFLCPKGHLLEGEEAHMGMACECPQCGATFLIPMLGDAAPAPAPRVPGPPPPPSDRRPAREAPARSTPPGKPGPPPIEDLSDLLAAPTAGKAAHMGDINLAAAADAMLHIPCPNGHELETPPEMIGQRAKCPHCGVEFKLRREKSIEYRHQLDLLDKRRARFWFQLAIIAACFVVVILLAMLVVMVLT